MTAINYNALCNEDPTGSPQRGASAELQSVLQFRSLKVGGIDTLSFTFPVLVGDIGGTNARFAVLVAPGETIRLLPRVLTAHTPSPIGAIRIALAGYDGPPPRSAIFAIATRVSSHVVRLTNAEWVIDAGEIGRAFNLENVTLVNDYTPVAASVTVLDTEHGDLFALGGTVSAAAGASVVMGPGTGLGVGALVPTGNRYTILASEAGHMELGPASDEETAIWSHLERIGGRVSAEGALSGPGLLRIAKALAAHQQVACDFILPSDVLSAACKGEELAVATLDLFARWLGRFAGDLALSFSATGGVFIAGGIAPRIVNVLRNSDFRRSFDCKAPHDEWASTVPVYVITNPEPALHGLAALISNPEHFIFLSQSWRAA
jgi:glucokinase